MADPGDRERPAPAGEPRAGGGPDADAAQFSHEGEDKLSVCSKLCYGIGGAPNQVAGSATSFFLQIYLLDIAQIPSFHVSWVLFIGKVLGAAADPLACFLINKSQRTKIGQLMPWLLGCIPFLIVSYFFLWCLPPFRSGRVAWYLTFYCLFQALYTFFQVPYSALTMFLTTDQRHRDSATAYRMAFEILGTLVGATLQGQIVAGAHTSDHCSYNHTTDLQESNSTILDPTHGEKVYMIAAGAIGGIYLVGFVALFFGVKEKVDAYALNTDRRVPFFKGHLLAVKHQPYMKLTASFLLISTAVQVEQGNFVLFCTHAAGFHSHFQNLVLTILVSAVASIPFWQWFLQHFGKKMAASGISWMIPFTIMLVTIPNLTLAYMVAFVSGLSIAASMLLPWSMLPDVVDHFRVQNPHSTGHETIFYSSYVFFTKIAAGIGLGISSSSLDFAGYKPGSCSQSSSVVAMLKILVGAVPSVLIPLGLLILLFYPINEKSRKETKYALEILRKNPSLENLSEKEQETSF
uniref:Sphingosine-1-phosphate transporter MFSD2B n=1 Tax=Pogona vitticeps TaxID=103695 RepID=A0ABM5GL63_9SAUR